MENGQTASGAPTHKYGRFRLKGIIINYRRQNVQRNQNIENRRRQKPGVVVEWFRSCVKFK